jgi:hypothetical protein
MCVRMFDRSLTCLRYVKMNGCFRRHISIINRLTSLLISRLSITALAVDNARGYVLVAVNDRQRHMHVVDLYNEARLLPLMPPPLLLHLVLL